MQEQDKRSWLAPATATLVPLNQDAGNAAAFAMLVGEQHSDIDIVSAQLVYRF